MIPGNYTPSNVARSFAYYWSPNFLVPRYNVNYVKLDDWYVEMASVEEGAKLAEKRLYLTGRLVRALPVTADIYLLEKDKNIGFEGGRAILLTGVRKKTPLWSLLRFSLLLFFFFKHLFLLVHNTKLICGGFFFQLLMQILETWNDSYKDSRLKTS